MDVRYVPPSVKAPALPRLPRSAALFEHITILDLIFLAASAGALLIAYAVYLLGQIAQRQAENEVQERLQRQTALGNLDMQMNEVLATQSELNGTVKSVAQGLIETLSTNAQLAGRIGQLSDIHTASQADLKRLMAERIEALSTQMGASMQTSAQRTMETLGHLNTRLAVIDAAQKNITELSTTMVGLQDILSNKQARGAFGEIQLEALVKDALPQSAYAFQAQLSNGRRVDCLIRMPNPPGPICVDAKFPLEAWQAIQTAADPAAKTLAAREFKRAVLAHVLAIRERYILPGETADSALMFLPSEAVYAELHTAFQDVVQKSYNTRVYIVSPTTMMATLHTVRAVLRDVQMREQANVIQKEVMGLVEDVGRLRDRVNALRKHMGQVSEDFNEISVSTDKIVKRGGRIEQMQFDTEFSDDAAAAATPVAPPRPAPLPRAAGGTGE